MIDILLSDETRISYEYSEKILWERAYPETPFLERDYTENVLLYIRSYTSVPLGMGNPCIPFFLASVSDRNL